MESFRKFSPFESFVFHGYFRFGFEFMSASRCHLRRTKSAGFHIAPSKDTNGYFTYKFLYIGVSTPPELTTQPPNSMWIFP